MAIMAYLLLSVDFFSSRTADNDAIICGTNRFGKMDKSKRSSLAAIVLSLAMVGNCSYIPPAMAVTTSNEAEQSPATEGSDAPARTGIQLAETISSTASSTKALEDVTKAIAQKENELIRLNTKFRSECTRTSKWKPWRMFVYNLGGSGCSEAGITEISATRWHYWTRPKTMPRSTGKAGPILLLVGHCITLGGVGIESTLDAVNDYKVRKKGLDINTTHHKVIGLKSEIDHLISQRQEILSKANELSSSELALAQAEGTVLNDVRDLSLYEYGQFYVRANKYFTNRNANSVMTAIAASTGGFQGSLLGIISAEKRRPKLVGPGGLGFVISGATIMATPPMTRLLATANGNSAKAKITAELGQCATTVSKLDSDLDTLAKLNMSRSADTSLTSGGNVDKRIPAYNKEKVIFTVQNEVTAREKTLADREFLERMFFATCIGGSKMSWGINLANAGFNYRTQIKYQPAVGKTAAKYIADPGPGKLFTQRVAIGATTYIPGTSLWLLDTFQNRFRSLARDNSLAKQNKLPAALLKERLDRVDEIESSFNY